jgi:glycosyltransferase involved in cell wall biosynthesis
MTPTVSIIIPCYNQARYLPLSIRSVQAQSRPDWEIVLVNDGSTDDTATIAAQFTDARIHYIYQTNQGLSAARNTGIHAAQGRYLAFLDSDDEWEPEFLEKCVQALESNPNLAGVYTRNIFIDQDGQVLPHIGGEMVAPAAFRTRTLEGGYFPPNAVLVVTAIVREMGLFDVALTSEEDWDLWLRISERYTMQAIAQPLARYRSYTGSMSTNAARMHANRIAVLSKYFGPPTGESQVWSAEKRRAYGSAFRNTCIGFLQQAQVDEAWQYLTAGVSFWPDLLKRLDTSYELACGDKPWGYRGQIDPQQFQAYGADMIRRLTQMLDRDDLHPQALRRVALGNSYLALGMLADQNGQWQLARNYLFKAWKTNPQLGMQYPFMRRLIKVSIGLKRRPAPHPETTAPKETAS